MFALTRAAPLAPVRARPAPTRRVSKRAPAAPESYGSRPKSKTLEEGRYRRPPPERVGGVTEDAVRGDDYEVVDGPSFGVGTLVGVLLAIATLGGAYLTVEKLQQGPVAPREGAVRMPATDRS